MIRIEIAKGDEVPYEELYQIMKDAFKERIDQGLDFVCLKWTLEEFRDKLCASTILLARDMVKNDKLIGFERLVFMDDRMLCGLIAISPEYKMHGVGTRLFRKAEKLAKSRNCKYLLADTAVGADSSVKWHLKNGFRIICLKSYDTTNYYSYIFRKQLEFHKLWSNPYYCKMQFYLSAIKCRLHHKKDGSPSALKSYYIKLRNLGSAT